MNDIAPVADNLALPLDPVTPLFERIRRVVKTNYLPSTNFHDRYVGNHQEVPKIIGELRKFGPIVFVTGVWDLYHEGHDAYLAKGKEEACSLFPKADYIFLVVGVDSDEVTKKRKGPKRPAVTLRNRSSLLAGNRVVDLIVPQYEENQLYKLIEHDVRIISTSTDDLPDTTEMKRYCKHLVNLPPQGEDSTTARLRRLALDGGLEALEKFMACLNATEKTVVQAFLELHKDVEVIANALKK